MSNSLDRVLTGVCAAFSKAPASPEARLYFGIGVIEALLEGLMESSCLTKAQQKQMRRILTLWRQTTREEK